MGPNLDWNLTLNFYRTTDKEVDNHYLTSAPSFNWYIDIPKNGDFTYITSVYGKADFLIRKHSLSSTPIMFIHPSTLTDKAKEIKIKKIALSPGDIIVLSDGARFNYEHCVKNTSTEYLEDNNGITRISIVLGAR